MEPARLWGLSYAYRFVYRASEGGEHETTVLIQDRREFIVRALRRLPQDGRLSWSAAIESSADRSLADIAELGPLLRDWLEPVIGRAMACRIVPDLYPVPPPPNCS